MIDDRTKKLIIIPLSFLFVLLAFVQTSFATNYHTVSEGRYSFTVNAYQDWRLGKWGKPNLQFDMDFQMSLDYEVYDIHGSLVKSGNVFDECSFTLPDPKPNNIYTIVLYPVPNPHIPNNTEQFNEDLKWRINGWNKIEFNPSYWNPYNDFNYTG